MDRRGFLKNLGMAAAGGALGLRLPAEAASKQSSLQALKTFQGLITPKLMEAQVHFLASDFFEGRETTTRGQRMAANYLASEYQRMGLEPRGTGSVALQRYLQRFAVHKVLPRESRLQLRRPGGERGLRLPDPAAAYPRAGALRDTAGGVVFAGYGIADDQLGYNDYAALRAAGSSVDGKWVLILDDEPLQDADRSLLPTSNGKPSPWSTSPPMKNKAVLGAGRPAGLLIVSDVSPRQKKSFREQAEDAVAQAERVGGALAFEPRPAHVIPGLYISTAFADELLASAGQSAAKLREKIAATRKPVVMDLPEVQLAASFEPFPALETENVIAIVPGSDPRLRDQFVMISAHYDHLGIDPRRAGDNIFNGASDDASGTAGTLAIAEAFAAARAAGRGPRRSIAFLNFSGEERGMLGSSFYVDREAAVPLEAVAALLNMDGIGGFDPKHPRQSTNYIYVMPDKEGNVLERTVREMNRTNGTGLELDPHTTFPSDQYSFSRRSVPFVYFSTGLVKDYHQPSDEPATLDYDHLARVTRLVFATAWQTANAEARPPAPAQRELRLTGFICPPCPYGCDEPVYEGYGLCPICGMNLVGKYSGSPG